MDIENQTISDFNEPEILKSLRNLNEFKFFLKDQFEKNHPYGLNSHIEEKFEKAFENDKILEKIRYLMIVAFDKASRKMEWMEFFRFHLNEILECVLMPPPLPSKKINVVDDNDDNSDEHLIISTVMKTQRNAKKWKRHLPVKYVPSILKRIPPKEIHIEEISEEDFY
jgi:hypothetical protein